MSASVAANLPSAVALGVRDRAHDRADTEAVATVERSLTFGELGAAVEQLATTIVEQAPTAPWLPVVVDRSIESIVAMLAVVHAGRAYAPIDAALPPTLRAELIARAGNATTVVVAKESMRGELPDGVRAVDLGHRHSNVVEPLPVASNGPGALVFTSGSSGIPKGVVRSWSMLDGKLPLEPMSDPANPARLSVLGPLSFSGGFGLVTNLALGRVVCMIDPRNRTVDQLLDWLADQRVDDLSLGAGPLGAVLRHPTGAGRLPLARYLSVNGTRCDQRMLDAIRSVCGPQVTVVNRFSATEVGEVVRFKLAPGADLPGGLLPVGVHMPDSRIRLVPGELGDELWVRDPESLGYHEQPELTAQRYVTDDEGVRWWRSGDGASIDEHGFIRFEGRLDRMVKINGMRIEPDETEHVLRAVPGISNAAVMVHTTARGDQRLVGHVCVDDPSLTPESVRAQLGEQLPSHLVPSVLMRHDALPYNDRHKLDRPALQAMPVERWRSSPAEQSVFEQHVWLMTVVREIIGLGDVGYTDDLWDAGLDSMGAVELCSRFAAAGFGDLDPTVLLRVRTVAALQGHLGSLRTIGTDPVVVLNEGGTRVPIVAMPGGGGTSIAFRSVAAGLGADQPIVVVEPRGMHTRGRIERTMAARTETLLRAIEERLDPQLPCLLVGYSGGVTPAFEAARRLLADGRAVHLVMLDGMPRDAALLPGWKLDWRRPVWSLPMRDGARFQRLRYVLRPIKRARDIITGLPKAARRWQLLLLPGSKRYSPERYEAFQWVQHVATERHTVRPLVVRTTLLHVANSTLPERCAPWVGELDCIEVGGQHFSMLHPPYVGTIVEAIRAVRDELGLGGQV